MLHTPCPFTARALRVARRRARFAALFGPFCQRTIDRRYCGLLNSLNGRVAALRLAGPEWFPLACRLAGGRPSPLIWQPFGRA